MDPPVYTGQFSVVVLVPGTTSLVVRFSASLSGSAVPGGASGLNFEVFRNPSHAGGVHFMRTKAAGLPYPAKGIKFEPEGARMEPQLRFCVCPSGTRGITINTKFENVRYPGPVVLPGTTMVVKLPPSSPAQGTPCPDVQSVREIKRKT
eukprot:1510407-Rhodomonas_salina.3